MKKVTLKELTLVNFRGHKNLTVIFNERTVISGDNRLGKSTIFDAFVWALFGKDQFDRKDFEIIPIINGQQLERIDPEVTIGLDVDGRNYTLRRVYHQKWVRKRGTAEEVFDGCETLYYINDVPQKAGEYKNRVDDMIEESVFKLITNPATFLNLHWTKQREFLFQIAGTVADAEIASTKPEFGKLLEMLSDKSLIDFKKELSTRKKKLKADLDDIQPRIDQTSRLMPESADWKEIEQTIKQVEKQIRDIETMMSDRAAAIRGQFEEIQAKQKSINDLKSRQMQIVNVSRQQETQRAFDANQERQRIENIVNTLKRSIDNDKHEIESINRMIAETKRQISEKEQELVTLRAEWNVENEKEYQEKSGCFICPVFSHECSDLTAQSKHEEAQDKAKVLFFENKDKKLKDITAKGQAKGKELEGLTARLRILDLDGEKAQISLEEHESDLRNESYKLQKIGIAKMNEIIANEIPAWQELDAEIKAIEATITEVKPVENADLSEKKAEHVAVLDELKKKLAGRDLITRYNEEIEKLEAQGKNIAQQIADLESMEFTIDAFNKVKIDEVDKRINRMFEIVKFKLFDSTIDGNQFEACIPTNKSGVPISATNTAERINAGLDLINVLSDFYNVSAPIFVDGAESVNAFIQTKAQMIHLAVTKEKQLTFSHN